MISDECILNLVTDLLFTRSEKVVDRGVGEQEKGESEGEKKGELEQEKGESEGENKGVGELEKGESEGENKGVGEQEKGESEGENKGEWNQEKNGESEVENKGEWNQEKESNKGLNTYSGESTNEKGESKEVKDDEGEYSKAGLYIFIKIYLARS